MILIDMSSIIHRKLFTSISKIKPKKINGKYVTSDFIGLTLHYIFEELLEVHQEFSNNYNEIVICIDNSSKGYWRRDVYPGYKASRKVNRDESEINYSEVFEHINKLIHQLKTNIPWKVVEVERAEADDIMLVLAKKYHNEENVLIHSPDKDMIQAQRGTETVHQYSPLTKKYLKPENKYDNMDHWITEHVCLGDTSDDVPRIVDGTEFSESFLNYLQEKGYDLEDPIEFKQSNISNDVKKQLIKDFDVYKTNRKGENLGIKDIYKDVRFGPGNLKKLIEKYGSLDNFLDSHPLYRKHYERNFILVMEEGIPDYIRDGIDEAYKEAETKYNNTEIEKYLRENNLHNVLMSLPNVFKIDHELTADDFDW